MGTDLIDFLVEQIYFWKKKVRVSIENDQKSRKQKLMDFLNSIQKQILNDAQKVDGKDKESRRRWLILCIKKVFFSNLKTNLI